MNRSSRKRKRNYGDSNKKVFVQDGDEKTTTIIAASSTTTTSNTTPYTTGTKQKQQEQLTNRVPQNLLFRDKIVVVTTLQQQQVPSDTNSTLNDTTSDEAPTDTTNNNSNGELTIGNTYKSVASFVQQHLGATITHQVHGRVYCVIASPQAIQEPTQRIRKAWKRNIPVVTTQYIYDCVQQQFLIPIPTIHEMPNQYRILPSSSASKSSSITKKTSIVLPTTPSEPVNKDDNVDIPERIIDLGCCCVCHDNDDTINDPCEWCIDCSYTKETTIK